MAEATKEELEAKAKATPAKGAKTHVRFVGHASDDEHSATEVFGKRFYRGKWVPIANLDGTNPEKKALSDVQLKKLLGNPAFQVGDGSDTPVPGMEEEDTPKAEEA